MVDLKDGLLKIVNIKIIKRELIKWKSKRQLQCGIL